MVFRHKRLSTETHRDSAEWVGPLVGIREIPTANPLEVQGSVSALYDTIKETVAIRASDFPSI